MKSVLRVIVEALNSGCRCCLRTLDDKKQPPLLRLYEPGKIPASPVLTSRPFRGLGWYQVECNLFSAQLPAPSYHAIYKGKIGAWNCPDPLPGCKCYASNQQTVEVHNSLSNKVSIIWEVDSGCRCCLRTLDNRKPTTPSVVAWPIWDSCIPCIDK